MGDRPRSRPRAEDDAAIEALAAKQHGVVARAQLLEAGLTVQVIDRRVQQGRLRVVHLGVYRVGPLESAYTREMAAVLACGAGGVASHRSACRLADWPAAADADGPVEVTVAHGHGGRRPGIRRYRSALAPDEATTLNGIPVTTPERTLLDLAAVVDTRSLERTLAHAEDRCVVGRSRILELLARRPRHRGAGRLRALLDRGVPPALTESVAEERFLELIGPTPIPAPATTVRVCGFRVDCFWRSERLVVEIDGFAFHSSRRAFERDRDRDATLAAAGIRVMRVTWNQLVNEPATVLVRLAQALARAGPG